MTAGQDGERLVTEEIFRTAMRAVEAGPQRGERSVRPWSVTSIKVALAAAAPKLDRAAADRTRRECADELRSDHPEDWKDNAGETDPRPWCWRCKTPWPCEPAQLALRWSSSGGAPAGHPRDPDPPCFWCGEYECAGSCRAQTRHNGRR